MRNYETLTITGTEMGACPNYFCTNLMGGITVGGRSQVSTHRFKITVDFIVVNIRKFVEI